MACCTTFCCGYSLRSGGSFVGYISIIVYICLFMLSIIFLNRLQNRIDELERVSVKSFRSKAIRTNYEVLVEDLKGESEWN